MKVQWVYCPICNNKTREKVREDTVIKNFPLSCPKCKQESLIGLNQIVFDEAIVCIQVFG